MKNKIIKSISILIIGILIISLFDIFEYGKSQTYANIATQQVVNDSSYYLLKTKDFIDNIILFSKIGVVIIMGIFGYFVWKEPKSIN